MAPVGRAASWPTNRYQRFIHRTGTPGHGLNPADRSPHTQADHQHAFGHGAKPG